MNIKQKYHETVKQIIKSHPGITLKTLIFKLFDTQYSKNNISQRLQQVQVQSNEFNDEQDQDGHQQILQKQCTSLQQQQLLHYITNFKRNLQNHKKQDKIEKTHKADQKIDNKSKQPELNNYSMNFQDPQSDSDSQEQNLAKSKQLNLKIPVNKENPQNQFSISKNSKKHLQPSTKPSDSSKIKGKVQIIKKQQPKTVVNKEKIVKKDVIQNFEQKSEQYEKLEIKLKNYLTCAYHQYSKQRFEHLESFEKNTQLKAAIDLRIFLKFYKEFCGNNLLKVPQVIKMFKKQAINGIWLDLERFLSINEKILKHKTVGEKNDEKLYEITNLDELLERIQLFLGSFTKEKLKKHLKISNKESLQQILDQYNPKNAADSLDPANKQQLINKFLARNFLEQVPKWLDKKQKNPEQKKSRSKSKIRVQNTPRDQGSISSNIQKLRSQSQRNLNHLRAILGENLDLQQKRIKKLKSESSEKRHVKPALSIYQQLQGLPVQPPNLLKQLQKKRQPFLQDFFEKEINTHVVSQRIKDKGKDKTKKPPLPKIKKDDGQFLSRDRPNPPIRNSKSQQKINYVVSQLRIENNYQMNKTKNPRSQPSHPKSDAEMESDGKNRKRVYSLKKPKASIKDSVLQQAILHKANQGPIKKSRQNLKDKVVNDHIAQMVKKQPKYEPQGLSPQNLLKKGKLGKISKAPSAFLNPKAYQEEIYEIFKYFNKRGQQEQKLKKIIKTKTHEKNPLSKMKAKIS